ncbi:hypothetical protein TNCV_4280311 [Trichonephila clavipes]|nr:hypothetical protein TNCV_4280311 [Trichonephila clavipes]
MRADVTFCRPLPAFRVVRCSSVHCFQNRITMEEFHCTGAPVARCENPPCRRPIILPCSSSIGFGGLEEACPIRKLLIAGSTPTRVIDFLNAKVVGTEGNKKTFTVCVCSIKLSQLSSASRLKANYARAWGARDFEEAKKFLEEEKGEKLKIQRTYHHLASHEKSISALKIYYGK